ncbi:MAG: YdjY domain-containing protein [Phycisphaerae bacterium]|jgi:hypothetical protein|nr:YdjY domain-containing protein [Phycisphaerae bacterium]
MRTRASIVVITAGILGWILIGAQGQITDPKGAKVSSTQPARRVSPIALDLKKRTISFSAEVCQREVMLEFMICRTGTKEHESILRSDVLPSHIHGGLLAMGLTRGKPARWSTGRDGVSRFGPPQGPELDITLEWTDKDGKKHKDIAGAWLQGVGKKKLPAPKTWVFVGSDMLPDNTYAADINGEIVSVSNFSSSLIDVPFESSSKGGEGNVQAEYMANPKVVPPIGTKVKVTIAPRPGAEKSPHARILLEIDRFGRMKIDGERILPGNLRAWVRKFVAVHRDTLAVIRSDAQTIVYDVAEAREELAFAGVSETEQQQLTPKAPIPPRSPEQAQAELKRWAKDFARAEHLLMDPAKQAQRVLAEIDRELARTERMRALWEDYAAALRQELAKHKASTQPADDKNKSSRTDGK